MSTNKNYSPPWGYNTKYSEAVKAEPVEIFKKPLWKIKRRARGRAKNQAKKIDSISTWMEITDMKYNEKRKLFKLFFKKINKKRKLLTFLSKEND